MTPFIFDLLGRSWSSFLSSLGTTGLGFFVSNIEYFAVTLLVTHLVIWIIRGQAAMREHAADNLKIGVLVYVVALVAVFVPIFCYQFFFKVPRGIRNEASRQQAPTLIALMPRPPSFSLMKTPHPIGTPLPSFVFAIPGVILNQNSWDFIIKHEGTQEVESIDFMFTDSNKLETIRKTAPPQTVVLPNEYSVFLHVDKMYPKGRGSLFAKQFIWKPLSFEHERYSVDISASTGRFHEDLFVEQVNGKWTHAAKVEDIETKRTLFACMDKDFPQSLAPMVVTKKKCWPDWIEQ